MQTSIPVEGWCFTLLAYSTHTFPGSYATLNMGGNADRNDLVFSMMLSVPDHICYRGNTLFVLFWFCVTFFFFLRNN